MLDITQCPVSTNMSDTDYALIIQSNKLRKVYQTVHKFPNWLQKILWVEFFNSTNTEYYVIVVPKGTISVDGTYQIDME